MSREIPADATTPGVVARYMIRPPITPERMLGQASSAQIIYRSDIVHPRHQANFRVFDPLDFLAEVIAHIPDPHEKTTLFYGWYSNRTRGYRKQPISSRKPKRRAQPPARTIGRPWRSPAPGPGSSARSTRWIRSSENPYRTPIRG